MPADTVGASGGLHKADWIEVVVLVCEKEQGVVFTAGDKLLPAGRESNRNDGLGVRLKILNQA